MNEIFDDKDKLLKIKSSIPVYYWFIRNNNINTNILNEFLNKSDELRKNAKDVDILEYNKYHLINLICNKSCKKIN